MKLFGLNGNVCRFTGDSLCEMADKVKGEKTAESLNPFHEPPGKNPFEEEDAEVDEVIAVEPSHVSPFHGLISSCFENHLNIYVDSQDKYGKLIDSFILSKIVLEISSYFLHQ